MRSCRETGYIRRLVAALWCCMYVHGASGTSPEELMDARLRRIQEQCGVLCNTRRPTEVPRRHNRWSTRFNVSVAPVNCGWLLADGTGIDATREQASPPEELPAQWLDEFTMHGRLSVRKSYINDTLEAHTGNALQRTAAITEGWQREKIDGMVRQAQGLIRPPKGKERGSSPTSLGWAHWTRYRGLNRELWVGMHASNVSGADVLVIGSESPWVEALCLGAGARRVMTLEYARILTDHPQVTTLTPPQFLARARAGTLPRFQVIVTASSVEHSGLGRYNDGLNPWGDILAIARAWCVSAQHARLVIAVPTAEHYRGGEAMDERRARLNGQDAIVMNSQRTYGPVRYPYLVANWRLDQRIDGGERPAWGQTVYTFRKIGRSKAAAERPPA